MITLRPYQERSIEQLRTAYARGRQAPCLVLPCGGGKTIISAAIIAAATARATRTLFVADRCTLIDQTVAKLALGGVTDVRIIQAERDEGPRRAPVTVASAQTLRTDGWQDQLPEADLVIWDECHGILADSYAGVLRRYPNARRLGLTATPCRGDGRALTTFDELVVGATVRELTELGHLAPARVLAPPAELEANQLAIDPVAAYRQHAAGQRAALFCATVAQAARYVADCQAAGITAELVTAKTRNRADILRRFAAGDFQLLASVGTLTQGWDDPGCGVAIIARRVGHIGLWLQICGRVLRPHPGKAHGLIVDLCGSVHQHGLPDCDQAYSLDGDGIRPLVRDAIRQCPRCGAMFPSAPRCPHCATALPARPRELPRATGVGVHEVAGTHTSRCEYVVAMTSKRWGTCATCGGAIEPGAPILWATQAKQAKHRQCRKEIAS